MNSEFHQRLRDAEAQVDRLGHALNVEREQAARFRSALLIEQRLNEGHQRTIQDLRHIIRKQDQRIQLMTEHDQSDGNTILALSRELAAVEQGDAPKILADHDIPLELRRIGA